MRKFLVLLLVSVFCLTGCARFKGGQDVGRDVEFENADRFAKEKRYSEAIAVYSNIAKESPDSERGANALFASASARAFYDNPHKDYTLALQEFNEFLQLYPSSEKAREAQNWRYFLKMMLELKKENEHLTKSIEELKRIDIRHEERRRK